MDCETGFRPFFTTFPQANTLPQRRFYLYTRYEVWNREEIYLEDRTMRVFMRNRFGLFQFCSLALVAGWFSLLPAPTQAEILVLTNGGRIEGEILNTDEKPRTKYVVKIAAGSQVTVQTSQVKEIRLPKPAEVEYEKIRHKYPDTIAGQWDLAEWCREQGLRQERKTHLERVIELEPDHREARGALGFNRVDGQWKTPQQANQDRGLHFYNGRWRTAQEIELLERTRKDDTAERSWFSKLKTWNDNMNGPRLDRAQAAADEISKITDPYAVPAIMHYLHKETLDVRRKMYLDVLSQINSASAIMALCHVSLEDINEDVRLTALDWLLRQPRQEVVEFYIGYLKNSDNAVINRAAHALGRLKNPMAIRPLMDSLITTHKFKVDTGSQNQYSAGFGTGPGGGGSGFSTGGGIKIIEQPFQNKEVLDALVALTGMNYEWDVTAWKVWLSTQKKPATLNARRD